MRLGVLDVGSNTVHLLVVDGSRGAPPRPTHSEKVVLRLAEAQLSDGTIPQPSVVALLRAVTQARDSAERLAVDDLIAFATSALRDAPNGSRVLRRVRDATGVRLRLLSGEEEARSTFLAVRRWFGWSAGRLLVADVGGGSLEIAAGAGEEPEAALSLPLGAGRLTRQFLPDRDPPADAAVAALKSYVDSLLKPAVKPLLELGWDRAAVTSATFRSLARLAGAAPGREGPYVPRGLSATGLRRVLGFIRHLPAPALARLKGVDPARAGQLLAGAVVAEAVLRHLAIESVAHCPWALREGLVLRRFDAPPSGVSPTRMVTTRG